MQIVKATGDVNVLDAGQKPAYSLRAGEQYVLYDNETANGLRDEALEWVATLDSRLPPYRGESLDGHRLILPFIGRGGDAVATAACLEALQGAHPHATIDIACARSSRDVFTLFPPSGELIEYPLGTEQIGAYHYHLSFEDVEAVRGGGSRSLFDLFSACLRTPRPTRPAKISVPPQVAAKWELPPGRPRVAIHIGRNGCLRSYPTSLTDQLVDQLAREGMDVYRVGMRDGGECPTNKASDIAPGCVHDLVNMTATPADLAAVLARMHAVVTCDSFPMHLAGALGVPTIALFTSTDAVLGSDYSSVTSLQSPAPCSPCRVSDGACPLGRGECVAHHEPSATPQRLAERVRSVVGAVV